MLKIPFNTYPRFSQDVLLDDETYRLKCEWNSRGEFWALSIYTPEDVLIVAGIKLVIGYDLLRACRHLAVPQGILIAIDNAENYEKIGYGDFSNDRKLELIYVEESDL